MDIIFWMGGDDHRGRKLPDGLFRLRERNVLQVYTGMSGCKDLTLLENLGADSHPFLNEQSRLHVSCAGKVQPGTMFQVELLNYVGVEETPQYEYREFSYPPITEIPSCPEWAARFEQDGPACVAGEEL